MSEVSVNLISKQLEMIHKDVSGLREDVREDVGALYDKLNALNKKVDDLNENKIIPLQIFKARTIALLAALSLGGGITGAKIDKIFFRDEKSSYNTTINKEK